MPHDAQRSTALRLRDMLTAAERIDRLAHKLTRERLEIDPDAQMALIGYVGIMGEAAAHVSSETRALAPEVPWQQVRGMRNILVHAYGHIDLDAPWRAATISVPAVIPAMRRLVDAANAQEERP